MTVHASLLAEPFLEQRGWIVEKHEVLISGRVDTPRAEMSKDLGPALRPEFLVQPP